MNQVRVFLALLHRDLRVLKKNLVQLFIDNIILLLVCVVEFGILFPVMGMPTALVGPLFMGHISH